MPKKTRKEKAQTDVRSAQGLTYTLPKLKEVTTRVERTNRESTVVTPASNTHLTNHPQVAKDITKITLLSILAFGIELLVYWLYQRQLG